MISVIICSIQRDRFTRITEQYRRLMGDEPHEIIGVHDAISLAEGYNRGLDESKGDLLIFSHDDLDLWSPEFITRIKKHMESVDILGVAGTNRLVGPAWYLAGPPHVFGQVTHLWQGHYQVHVYGAPGRLVRGIQAMDGLLLAFRREAIERLRWDDATFDDFHCYDVDCTFRGYQGGLRLGVALDLPVFHHSRGMYGDMWRRYSRVFMEKHGRAIVPMAERKYQHTVIQLETEEEAREVMGIVSESVSHNFDQR